MRFFFLVAALTGCHNGGGNPDDTSGSDTSVESGIASLTYNFTVLGEIEPCQITAVCGNETFSAPSGETIEVAAPTSCTVTAGVEIDGFDFPAHLGEGGEYWAAPPLSITADPDDALTGAFESFNLFKPGDYVCWYDKYELDEEASDLKGEQWMDHQEIDKQFVSVLQDGSVEAEDNQSMSVIGRNEDHMQVVDDQLVLVVEAGGNPYYIDSSDIGVDYFNLTTVNTEAGYVADVWCELDD